MHITTALKQHQLDALDYLKSHDPCALFMKVGCGKSIIALAYAAHIQPKMILVTSDKNNIVNTWPDQIYEHVGGEYHVEIRPRHPENLHLANPCFVLANYEWVTANPEWYGSVSWDLWIGDESSEFKDQRTDKFKTLAFVTNYTPHKVILNGTAMTERLEDMYGQMRLIGEQAGRTLTQFHQRYMQPSYDGYGWEPKRSAFTAFQRDVQGVTYWMPEMPPDIVMPKRTWSTMIISPGEQQAGLDVSLRNEMRAALDSSDTGDLNYASTVFLKRHQLTGGILRGEDSWAPLKENPKLDALVQLLKCNREAKIVVWHEYVPETEIIYKRLQREYLDCRLVTDSSDTDTLEDFKAADHGVLLMRLSMCKGLNQLADADIAIFYSHPFSYRARAQALGRTARISSKTQTTNVVDLITKDGVDERIFHMLNQKSNLSLTMNNLRSMIS
jgi:hypothetical protein